MEIFIVNNYKEFFPEIKGKALTDRIIIMLLTSKSSYGYGARADDITIRRDTLGKPSICWNLDRLAPFLSLSHSENMMACAFDSSEIGIDIQHERRIDIERIGSRVFSKKECREISEDGTGRLFYKFWTEREAMCKYTGLGMQELLMRKDISENRSVDFHHDRLPDGAYLCICKAFGAFAEERDGYNIQFIK